MSPRTGLPPTQERLPQEEKSCCGSHHSPRPNVSLLGWCPVLEFSQSALSTLNSPTLRTFGWERLGNPWQTQQQATGLRCRIEFCPKPSRSGLGESDKPRAVPDEAVQAPASRPRHPAHNADCFVRFQCSFDGGHNTNTLEEVKGRAFHYLQLQRRAGCQAGPLRGLTRDDGPARRGCLSSSYVASGVGLGGLHGLPGN